MIRDLVILTSGFAMGWAWQGLLRPAARDVWKMWRKLRRPTNGFVPRGAAPAPPDAMPRPQPPVRPVRGQRASEGVHRAKVAKVRYGSRSFRRRQPPG